METLKFRSSYENIMNDASRQVSRVGSSEDYYGFSRLHRQQIKRRFSLHLSSKWKALFFCSSYDARLPSWDHGGNILSKHQHMSMRLASTVGSGVSSALSLWNAVLIKLSSSLFVILLQKKIGFFGESFFLSKRLDERFILRRSLNRCREQGE